jgi:hypothetical protein
MAARGLGRTGTVARDAIAARKAASSAAAMAQALQAAM